MNSDPWVARCRQLEATLDAASDFAATAHAALELARHRAALTELDWNGFITEPFPDRLLPLLAELPSRERQFLSILLAAACEQKGFAGHALRLIQEMPETPSWPIDGLADLSLPWAFLLTAHPELLREFYDRTGQENRSAVFGHLARFAPDSLIQRVAELCEQVRDRGSLAQLLSQMIQQARQSAMQDCARITLADHPGEVPLPHQTAKVIHHTIHSFLGGQLLAAGRLDEAIAYYREHFEEWRNPLSSSAQYKKNLPALRFVLQSLPDKTCSSRAWLRAAQALAEETNLAEVWPTLQHTQPAHWKGNASICEELVERGLITGELDIAEKIVDLLPPREAKPLRRRLEKASAKTPPEAGRYLDSALEALRTGSTDSALENARAGLAAAKGIKSAEARRNASFRFAACLIAAGAAPEGFAVLRRATQKVLDMDDLVERCWEMVDIFAGMNRLDVLATRCAVDGEQGIEWGWPRSLMNLAIARLVVLSGCDKALQLCQSLPDEPRKEALMEYYECLLSHGTSGEILDFLRMSNAGCIDPEKAVEAVQSLIRLNERARSIALAESLMAEWNTVPNPESAEALERLRQLIAQSSESSQPGAWPVITLTPESLASFFPSWNWEQAPDPPLEDLKWGGDESWLDEGWRKGGMAQVIAEVIETSILPTEGVELEEWQVENIKARWPELPDPDEYLKFTRNEERIAEPVQAALRRGDHASAARWLDRILQITRRCPADQSARALRLLTVLSEFALAGVAVPDFKETATDVLSSFARTDDVAWTLRRAKVYAATENRDGLARLLFEETRNPGIVCAIFKVLAWRLPEDFFLCYRREFARNTGRSDWMVAVAAVRGKFPKKSDLSSLVSQLAPLARLNS